MIALLFALAAPPQGPVPRPIPADAYADSATRLLVEHARAARARNERLVTGYTATVTQRMGVGIHALGRDRMLYRQEAAANITWHRDAPSSIEFTGAREGIPVAVRGDQLPNLTDLARTLVMDPASDYLRGLGTIDEQLILYPLSDGAEQSYRFATGSSVTLTLPGGKKINIIGLEVIPRRSEPNLMSGTLWFDGDSYNLVRAVYRPARPYQSRRDDHDHDVPDWVNASFEIKFVTLEYGLYDNRWWMPRYMAIDGTGAMGSSLNVPFRMERTYGDYTVTGGTPPDSTSTFRPAGRSMRTVAHTAKDSAGRTTDSTSRFPASDSTNLVVVPPSDTTALLTSTTLGSPILQMGDLISESELRQVGNTLDRLPSRPWEAHLELPRGVGSLLRGARYNRIESLSLGTGLRADFGRLALEGSARFGFADQIVNGELSLIREPANGRMALTGYRRLAAANPETHPFSIVSSAQALFFQRDDGEYFRATGGEFTIANTNTGWWSARLFTERESAAQTETQSALPHLFSDRQSFRPNIAAAKATQYGGSLTLRASKPLSRVLHLGVSSTVDIVAGDYQYDRAALTLRALVTPQHGPLTGALTVAGGTSTGTVPPQSQFFLGGPATLRGYAGGSAQGNAYWLARAEAGTSFPGARVVGFTDLGWAGPRSTFGDGGSLSTAGVGVSLLDGLLRIDLARALSLQKGWRLEFYLDGAM